MGVLVDAEATACGVSKLGSASRETAICRRNAIFGTLHHTRAESEQDHARENVDDEGSTHRRAREQHEPGCREGRAQTERASRES
jgi:hypothetical protein